MELNFREFYQEYGYGGGYGGYDNDNYGGQGYLTPQQQRLGVLGRIPSALPATAGGAYLGLALGGPVGALAGAGAGYLGSKFLGPKGNTQANPRAFTYYRGEDGRVYRHLPSAPEGEDYENMTPERAEELNADPTHAYIWTQGHDGKWHASKKGSQRYGYGQPQYGRQQYPRQV